MSSAPYALRLFMLGSILSAACFAQDSVYLGSIGGRVTDASGAVIQGARVTARQTETNLTADGVTDGEGRFRFAYQRLGPYELRVTQSGFALATRQLTLTVGSAFEIPVELKVAAAGETITVNDIEVLEAARTQVAGTVSQAEIRNLPLNGRSFLDVALLIPGVSPTNTASNQLFAETSSVPGQGISVGSQRNFSNNFIVDGLSANDDAAGLSGFYGLDVVSEFQVVTSGGQAEFGRALGGSMNVVTKSGTNALHGDLYGYFRNRDWNAANALSHTVLPLTQAQYGVSLGGPIRADRTFFFSNFEQRILNQSGLITIAPVNVAAINTRLDAVGFQGPRISTGLYSNPVHYWNYLGKIDHQVNKNDLLTVRYSAYSVNARNQRGAGALNAASASQHLDNTDQTIAASNVWTISPRLLNETRGQFTHSDLSAPPSDETGPQVSIAGVATFGRLSSSPLGRKNKLYELVDNLSYQAGAHSFRLGGSFLYNNDDIFFPRTLRGSYAFSSLANFLSGTYNNQGFGQTFGNPTVHQTNPNLGFYAQDQWKVHPRLTFNLGLRYDLQWLRTISTDTNNLSPRGGFAWTPFASRKMVVRGSYDLFYDRVPLRAVANALLSAGNTTNVAQINQVTVALSPGQAGAPAFPSILTSGSLQPGVLFNFTTIQSNLQNAYSQQGSLEIEQQIGRNATVSVGYQHLRGLHLIVTQNQNVPTCAVVGTNNGCRPNSAYGNNSRYSSLGDSHYDGLHVSYSQRPARFGAFRISYTYSKSLNNVGEFFFSQPIDHFNIWRDYGRSDDDQRHRFVFDGSIHSSLAQPKNVVQWITHGFTLSTMLQYYSALPFNITTGVNTVQGTGGRPTINGAFINRNAGTGFDFLNLNMRLSRAVQVKERLRFEVLAEAFNSLNHTNGVTRNGVFGTGAYPSIPSSAFGQTTAVQDPRTLQLALRIGF
ncbi:MAG: carboxypeptidase regulatory-like domain-containing protein [Bryobacteraceae bacterium]